MATSRGLGLPVNSSASGRPASACCAQYFAASGSHTDWVDALCSLQQLLQQLLQYCPSSGMLMEACHPQQSAATARNVILVFFQQFQTSFLLKQDLLIYVLAMSTEGDINCMRKIANSTQGPFLDLLRPSPRPKTDWLMHIFTTLLLTSYFTVHYVAIQI